MKEKIKRFIKPILVIIVAGFIVSFLYIALSNKDNESSDSKSDLVIKLPESSGNSEYDYSYLESRIDDLEFQISNLESRIDDLEWTNSDLEGRISELESDISSFRSCLRIYFTGSDYAEESDLYYCAGKLPY